MNQLHAVLLKSNTFTVYEQLELSAMKIDSFYQYSTKFPIVEYEINIRSIVTDHMMQ